MPSSLEPLEPLYLAEMADLTSGQSGLIYILGEKYEGKWVAVKKLKDKDWQADKRVEQTVGNVAGCGVSQTWRMTIFRKHILTTLATFSFPDLCVYQDIVPFR